MFSSWKSWSDDQAVLALWHKRYPDSLALAMAETVFWRTYAWNARGGGYASSVAQEGWALYGQRLARAEQVLASSRKQAATCPLWYAQAINIYRESGQHALSELEAVYEEGATLFPESLDIHFAMASAYVRRWGGSDARFEAFARRAAAGTKAFEGDGLYARLYWSQDSGGDNLLRFDNPAGAPSWPLMRSGFEDLMKRYPDSTANLNKFAALACRANDRPTYLRLRGQIGGLLMPGMWLGPDSVQACDQRMSSSGG